LVLQLLLFKCLYSRQYAANFVAIFSTSVDYMIVTMMKVAFKIKIQ